MFLLATVAMGFSIGAQSQETLNVEYGDNAMEVAVATGKQQKTRLLNNATFIHNNLTIGYHGDNKLDLNYGKGQMEYSGLNWIRIGHKQQGTSLFYSATQQADATTSDYTSFYGVYYDGSLLDKVVDYGFSTIAGNNTEIQHMALLGYEIGELGDIDISAHMSYNLTLPVKKEGQDFLFTEYQMNATIDEKADVFIRAESTDFKQEDTSVLAGIKLYLHRD